MKKYILFFVLALFAQNLFGQVLRPISWQTKVSSQEVKAGETIELIFTADIDADWYLYSSDFSKDLGPMVTTFGFTANDGYELVGEIQPIKPKKKNSDLWGGEYTYFIKKAEFRQTVRILKDNAQIVATVDYQVCTDVDGKCIPLDEKFGFSGIKLIGELPTTQEEGQTDTKEIEDESKKQEEKEEKKKTELTDNQEDTESDESLLTPLNGEKQSSLLSFMLLAFLSGFAALLTPCVFPIIPMTVSFFTNKAQDRKKAITQGLLYGASIVGIYTIIGVFVSYVFGPEIANVLATHWFPNILFFLVFIVFAISFFGAFDIVLPSSLVNKMDKQADKGGFIGIFFMALTLVVVSFSCTGPIAGSILIQSANGEFLKPVAGMFAFSMAFALPFTMFAIFPSWLSSLPQSGGWLNSVKVVLGFLELALAFKFLSVADQVYHWGLLDRHIYIAIWIVIFATMGFYLLGKIRLPHDSPLEKIGVGRFLLAIATFTFVVYLIPGMFGAPLKALAGYLPPQTTHDFDLNAIIRNSISTANISTENTHEIASDRKYADILHLPHGLEGYFDYEEALAAAKKANKPVFIDFTGHGCVNCREMEANVWITPPVLKRLKEDFVILALYVDDPTEVAENEWVKSSYDGKMKKTIGKINADFQITRFNNNAQPYYILLDTDGKMLVAPQAYDLNVSHFVKFLDAGLAEFEKRH